MQQEKQFDVSLAEEGLFRLLVEGVTDYAIYMLDPGGIVASWNNGARKFKGYEASEIIGQHFSRFYTEEDKATDLPARALATAMKDGKFEAEGWRVRKDGTRFWAHVVIDTIRRDDGTLVGFAKITRDLTERKITEAALRRSEEQLRILLQGISDYAIYMLDTEGKVASWNLGAQRIKGYLPNEIIGEHFSRFYTEEDRRNGEPAKALSIAAREGKFEKEGWRIRKDGTRFAASVVIDPLRDERGEIIGFAKITRDITERRQSEARLEKAREALFQSQKMETVGQLTGGVAHDFNNLLMVILASLELLRKRIPADPKTSMLIDNAVSGAKRGAALTQRMLAFARRQDLKPEAVELRPLVEGMLEMLQRTLGPSVKIQNELPANLDMVMADANQLELALLNLAINARDAMPGGGTLTIKAHEEGVGFSHPTQLEPGRYICLSVGDTGEGMDAGTLARATEPFFTTKGVGKGTGLGLSMVQGMTVQSGGKFFLKSELGKGTTAELWFPIAAPGAVASAQKEHPARETNVRPRLVLAVDDDTLVLFNTTAMLEDLGHRSLSAESGAEALHLLRLHPVELVITDQAMPHMTGIQLMEAIKAEWPDLPVILATGYAELPKDADAPAMRLNKPFSEAELAEAIAHTLGQK